MEKNIFSETNSVVGVGSQGNVCLIENIKNNDFTFWYGILNCPHQKL